MSLLKIIQEARKSSENAKLAGWSHSDTWNLVTINFSNHQEADDAYCNLKPVYDDIVSNQTWDGQTAKGIQPDATKVSFRHHLWIDENDDGYTLCCSFDNGDQAHDFRRSASEKYQPKFEHFTILQRLSDNINRCMEATHSVAVDVIGVATADRFARNFCEAARPNALYTDIIMKPDAKRCKAYFADEAGAREFAGRIKNVVYTLRPFVSAKPEQPKRP